MVKEAHFYVHSPAQKLIVECWYDNKWHVLFPAVLINLMLNSNNSSNHHTEKEFSDQINEHGACCMYDKLLKVN